MNKESLNFLEKLLVTPSPSGFETEIQKQIKRRMSQYADEAVVDVHGNLRVTWNPQGKIPVMLAGHCDQIGLMVVHIDNEGYLYVDQIGGIDPSVLPGSLVTVHTKQGPLSGVIGHTPVHLVELADRGRKIELKSAWIDIGVKDGAEAKKLVEVGDPVTYKLGVTRLKQDFIASPGCDDRVGAFVVMEALRLVASKLKGSERKKCPIALHAVSTVQEELGLRGAVTSSYSINPVAAIAVDVTHASDNPGAQGKKFGSVKLGQGPVLYKGANINPVLGALLSETAQKKKIAKQHGGLPRSAGNDSSVIQLSRGGVATAIVAIPNRYMHTQVEAVSLKDLEAAAKLIAETVMRITSRTSFIPS